MAGRGKIFKALHAYMPFQNEVSQIAGEKSENCEQDQIFSNFGSGRGRLIQTLTKIYSQFSCNAVKEISKSDYLIHFDDTNEELEENESFLKFQEDNCPQSNPVLETDSFLTSTGNSTEKIEFDSNFIRLNRDENYGVFLYVIEFQPPLEDCKLVKRILESDLVLKRLKAKPFIVGSNFYLPQKIESFELYPIPHVNEIGKNMKMIITFIKSVPLHDQIILFNFLFKEIMQTLNYSYMKNKYFDINQAINLEEWMMEIWPGYALEVVQFETNDLLLLCDISHPFLHKTNIVDQLKLLMPNYRYQEVARRYLCGRSVITIYNKQTYRIDDIDFNSNPSSIFKWGNLLVTYHEYFKKQWGVQIENLEQPLLIHKKYSSKTKSVQFLKEN